MSTIRLSAFAAASLLVAGVSFSTSASAATVQFRGAVLADGSIGTDWFNPANWSGGRVPSAGDDVLLDGTDDVLVDERDNTVGGAVRYRDLVVRDDAKLEVINGAVLQGRDQVQADRGSIVVRASGDVGETLVAEGGTVVINPNQKSKRIIVLQSSVTVDLGLGGTTPSSVTQDASGQTHLVAGRGTYSTIDADTLSIDGDLKLSTYYGFEPRPGDRFQIATVNGTQRGTFIGLPEGGYVGCTETAVCLRISYQGGDGNDLVLVADAVDPQVALLLPAVQKVREAASRMNAEKKLPPPTTPISGPKPPRK